MNEDRLGVALEVLMPTKRQVLGRFGETCAWNAMSALGTFRDAKAVPAIAVRPEGRGWSPRNRAGRKPPTEWRMEDGG
jgi:hypothetical protein